ncbi:hypothetical protein [Sphingomonas sp.]|uniref:hypothetical protein n=1 Tax=Sphingomonas sp. TaxID=28214 RepID=UPI00286E6E93|nr:hypothetical protein [Sphingomonas sp.]
MRTLAIAIAALCIGSTAAAQAPATPASGAQSGKNARDPDEVVCEKVEVIGSRLVAKRVCATRAQWAERRLRERLDIDKAQKTGMKGQ